MNYLQELVHQLDYAAMCQAALRVLSVLLCLSIHETCHGIAAYALGDPTAKRQHRLSLNPLRHIDWFGLLLMFTVGFGWAKPVPVDPRYFKNPKRGMAVTALAGPVSNLLFAVLLMLLGRGIDRHIAYTDGWNTVFQFLISTAVLSIGLGLFNLIPIPPLDGSKVLAAFFSDRVYAAWMRYERYGMLLLLVLSLTDIGGGLINRGIIAVYTFLSQWILFS